MNNKSIKQVLSILFTFIIIVCSTTVVYCNDYDTIIAQYRGSTVASYGYNPFCTFTITKISAHRFRGTFSAQNIASFLPI